ncbi:MAG: thioredoxin family protein [Candidatus Aenigmatarchaeota archaeon]
MELNDNNFEDEVLGEEGIVFVDFWGSWCLACQQMKPIIKQLKEEIGDRVKICHINIDKNRTTADRFEIEETPTHILFRDGDVVERLHASRTKNQLKKMIEKHIDR